ncbi:MAG: VanZ family protein [Acidobacteriia bacterium]|nr:VanZ family protein [Terriglobia bacterium]
MNKPVGRAWIPALLWLAVIAFESTSLMSAENTGHLLLAIARFFDPRITLAQLQLLNAVGRKIGHCVGYGILSLLMLRAWWATLTLPRSATRLPSWSAMVTAWSARAAVLALLSAAAVASLDEWHQVFLPGRTGTIRDVALDTTAAAFVQLLFVAVRKARGKQEAISN